MAVRKREIVCEYQPYIDTAPVQQGGLIKQASSNDGPTIESWRDIWIANTKANHATHGPFKARSLGSLHGAHRLQPAIVIGSGPSLKLNAAGLKANPGIPVLSCLHNFHFLEDLGVKVDYYVSLDAGPVTVEEVSEGGSKSPEEYWAMTEGKTLLCYIGSHPDLLAKWRGKVYFFNCPVPDQSIRDQVAAIEPFNLHVGTGGNVLGAATYIAKAIFGCNPIALIGADFSFSYCEKFHGWDSKYDKDLGHYLKTTDVFGNSVKTWQSYANFKAWFDHVAQVCPGHWVNCTEGGTWGAYPQGNIRRVEQMDLEKFIEIYSLLNETKAQCEDPTVNKIHMLF